MTTPTPPVLDVVHYEVPPVNPSPNGLFPATTWISDPDNRFFNGVEVRGPNYGGEDAFGTWEGHYCSVPPMGEDDQRKDGARPDILDAFDPITVWAYDECDPTAPSRAEVLARAAQILRLEEQVAIEREFANRMLTDAGTPAAAATLRLAVGYIEGVLALTNTLGFIHIGAQWVATDPDLFIGNGGVKRSPMGHTWVIGGGYVDALGDTIVATSQPYGWRNEPVTRGALDAFENNYAAIAERTVLIGYEALIAAATITEPETDEPETP
ncbi:major capsid pentamer protein [Mycobacterium phage Mutante]|uniref:Major capsid pentamer protein n=22 Tax=Pegunavirus TaxID=1623295 RepID=Q716R2_9CAUD|nr:hypothetical protein PBI_PG1_13 [Mycobacterium phage PG1]YP_009208561.1 hypothetical protein AVV54_gp013 [Mycobacterium phage Kikipoo]YP_009211811.1 hypothetical protein AVV57_gp13 [Mycobacterium phage Phipps]ACI12733.1 major capsid pentamer protein [Mycobacterium phage Chah]ACU41850.1 major capsid pentamer protein [Mycobacterium phage Puhltonio]AEJ91812.1 major capsid pentamer protein [Mycobacterium phage Thora]AEK08765.1 major capsid pentamer protein [Mycobacterium phage Harvey]AER47140